MDNYFFDTENEVNDKKVFVLIIYDISSNKNRVKFAKYLQGYGFRIQKSAFEALITIEKYQNLLRGIPAFIEQEDSVKVYKIIGKGQVKSFGVQMDNAEEEIIVI